MSSAVGELCSLQDLQYQNETSSVLQRCRSQQHTSQCPRGSLRRTLYRPYAFWGETSRPCVDRAPSEQIHSPFSWQSLLILHHEMLVAQRTWRGRAIAGVTSAFNNYIRFKLRDFLASRIICINNPRIKINSYGTRNQ